MVAIHNPDTGEIREFDQEIVTHPFPFSAGPRMIRNVLLDDGEIANAHCSDKGADTFFSIPAKVYRHGKTISGFVTRDTEVWRFHAYTYYKNHALIGEKQNWIVATLNH